MLTVQCPKCGSEDIREMNTAYAELPVIGWEWTENTTAPCPEGCAGGSKPETCAVCMGTGVITVPLEHGELRPADYDTDQSVDWETMDTAAAYVCRGCHAWRGSLDELTVFEESELTKHVRTCVHCRGEG